MDQSIPWRIVLAKAKTTSTAKRNAIDKAEVSAAPATTPPPRSKVRVFWFAVAVIAGVGSIIFGLVAFEDTDLRRAEKAFANGKLDNAKIDVEAYLDSHPESGRAQTLYAQILVNKGEQPEKALAIFEKFRAATPAEMYAWARAYAMTGQWSAAVVLLEQVVQNSPENLAALEQLIIMRIRMNQLERAHGEAQRLSGVEGREANGYAFIALIEEKKGDSVKAREAFAKVLEYEPNGENLLTSPERLFEAYADTLLRSGDPKLAKEMAERSISYVRSARAFVILGDALEQLGDSQRARLAWRECISADVENVEARNRLAKQELADKKPKDALIWMERVGKRDDITFDNAYLIERCYRALKNKEMAEIWAARSKKLRDEQVFMSGLMQASIESPNSTIAICFDAWQLAKRGNWAQANVVMIALRQRATDPDSKFLAKLEAAIKDKSFEAIPDLREWEAEVDKSPEEDKAADDDKANEEPSK